MKQSSLLLFAILYLSISHSGLSQPKETTPSAPKNSTQLSIGGPFLVHLNISHERYLKSKPLVGCRVLMGIYQGAYYNSDDDPPGALMIGSDIVMLTSSSSSTFEFNIGFQFPIIQTTNDESLPILPRINLTYRKTWKQSLIRIGLGFPDIISLGIGINHK